MLHFRGGVAAFDIGHRMRAALIADQQRITLREIARARGARHDFHQPAIGIVRMPGRNALGDDRRGRVLADMDHLRPGIGLLMVMRQRHGIELTHRAIALQDAGRVFPGNRRAGFHLRPGNFRIPAPARAALGDKIIDAAFAFGIARDTSSARWNI